MKINVKILLTLIIVLVGLFLFLNSNKEIKSVCINEKCFLVEIADSNEERIKGLSNRDFLEENKGMFFIFEKETVPNFWMKDMNFPIDIIWIDKEMKIVGIEENIQPCFSDKLCQTFSPMEKIKYVLEINAGLSDENNFTSGESIIFN
ncbi:MAG: DUF192 domain-containing protein [Nanoarchaeota archaeon]